MTPNRARLLLGVDARATGAQVEEAFRRRAWLSHPDRGGSAAEFAALAEARAVLAATAPGRGADGRDRPSAGHAPVVVVPDGSILRETVTRAVLRWAGRRGPRRVI